MNHSFWRAIDSLGCAGAALHDWKFHLDDDFEENFPLLRPTGRTAFCIIDPRKPVRRLTVDVDGEDGFVGYDDENTALPPVYYQAADVAEYAPSFDLVAKALAPIVGFDYGAWESKGAVRRVGSIQDGLGHVRPVLLFLPPGRIGDHDALLADLLKRSDATVLLPSGVWLSPQIELLRSRFGLTFVNISDWLSTSVADDGSRLPLPVHVKSGRPPRTARAIIHGGNGLAWEQMKISVGADRCIHFIAPKETRIYRFRSNAKITAEHPLGILMVLVRDGEWQNPAVTDPSHERVSRAFHRPRSLLKGLVPIPGDPFKRQSGAWVPAFEITLHREIASALTAIDDN